MFSIREIENMTGIKAHTLRAWEQRYHFITPRRKSSRQRIYDNQDLKYLLSASILYHSGWKISNLVKFTKYELDNQIVQSSVGNIPYIIYVLRLLECALDFDEPEFGKIVNAAVEQFGFEQTVYHVLLPLLFKLGQLRQSNDVISAHEHFASQIVEKLVSVAIDRIGVVAYHIGIHVGLFTPAKEINELYLLMMQYLLKKELIRSTYFGTGVSIAVMKEYCHSHGISHVYTHIVRRKDMDPEEFISQLSSAFMPVKVVVSGHRTASIQREFINVHLISNEEGLKNFLDKLKLNITSGNK